MDNSNIIRFINSKDVRKHLADINYSFTFTTGWQIADFKILSDYLKGKMNLPVFLNAYTKSLFAPPLLPQWWC